MSRDLEFEDYVDHDKPSLRAAWLIAMLEVKRGKLEALWNVIRLHPATHWRTGAKLVRVFNDE